MSIDGTPSIVDSGKTTLTGSYTGSVSSDKATVTYTWILPDNTTKIGSEIEADSPGNYSLTVKITYLGHEVSTESSINVIQKYTVIFMNGTTEILKTTVDSGTTAAELDVDVPKQSGYIFGGWQRQDGFTIYDPITSPTTFYSNMIPLNPDLIVVSGEPYTGQSVSLGIADSNNVVMYLWSYSDNEFPSDEEMVILDEAVATKTGYYWVSVMYDDGSLDVGMVYIEFSASPGDTVIIPPFDDDDDYIPLPPTVVDQSDSSDDTTTIVACAAAAVVAALMAAFLIIERRRN